MTDQSDEPPAEARKLPTGRIARTARVGGLVTSQGARWAGMRAANRIRSPERAATAQNERTAELVNRLVDELGQMRGAAMKVGQVLSMVEFDGLPEDERDALQGKLAELRDDVPPVPFAKIERLLRFGFENFEFLFDAFLKNVKLFARNVDGGTIVFVENTGENADELDVDADATALLLRRRRIVGGNGLHDGRRIRRCS